MKNENDHISNIHDSEQQEKPPFDWQTLLKQILVAIVIVIVFSIVGGILGAALFKQPQSTPITQLR